MRDHFQVPIKYSQNFITNTEVIRRVVNLADIGKKDLVIEFGGGDGSITRELASLAANVITIEKDFKLFERLKENLKEFSNVEVLNEEILDYKLPIKGDYLIFSNIPFSITSEIVNKIAFASNPPLSSYLFMQKEAGDKIKGNPESQSSISIKPFFKVESVYEFNRRDFTPVPAVDIVLVKLEKVVPKLDLKFKNQYRDFVIYGFSQWKENIRKALRKVFSNLQMKIMSTELHFSIDSRPSDLTLDQWIGLFNSFVKIVPVYKQKLIKGRTDSFDENLGRMREKNREVVETTGFSRNAGNGFNKSTQGSDRRFDKGFGDQRFNKFSKSGFSTSRVGDRSEKARAESFGRGKSDGNNSNTRFVKNKFNKKRYA